MDLHYVFMILLLRQFYSDLYLFWVQFNIFFTSLFYYLRIFLSRNSFLINRRYGFKVEREYINASFLYSFQVVLTILLACEPTLLYATETTALGQTIKVKKILLILNNKYHI